MQQNWVQLAHSHNSFTHFPQATWRPSIISKVQKAVSNLKQRGESGPDRLTPETFRDGGQV